MICKLVTRVLSRWLMNTKSNKGSQLVSAYCSEKVIKRINLFLLIVQKYFFRIRIAYAIKLTILVIWNTM